MYYLWAFYCPEGRTKSARGPYFAHLWPRG